MIEIGSYRFDGPYTVGDVPQGSGVYAVLTKPIHADTYAVVYIGQTENFNDRVTVSHRSYPCWESHRQGNLEVFIHYISGGIALRESTETELIKQHSPPCNLE